MRISRASLPATTALLTACVLAGCGGSSSTTGTTAASAGSTPTKAEYVAKANAICAHASSQTGKLLGELESATTAALSAPSASGGAHLADLVAGLHSAALRVLGQLQALTPPSSDRAAVAQFLTPLATAIGGLGQAETAISSGHASQALSSLLDLQSKTPQLAAAAQAYGLTQCEGVLSGTPSSTGTSG
jgi:hypothetical protein